MLYPLLPGLRCNSAVVHSCAWFGYYFAAAQSLEGEIKLHKI